jgi:1-aminocyclopropane-1-carboxylate deaminase/D-cysteine desulfhydrase-like pyridoxal-dependent ACC family enzyme
VSALFDTWPQLRGKLPWVGLGKFPTRVHRVEGLAPPSVELWVKRDDESGAAYGGNKVRKLEFLLAEAKERGAKRVCTLGGIGSHHVLATAIYGREVGLGVEAIVFPQPWSGHVAEQLLADVAAGAHLVATRSYLGVPPAVWKSRGEDDAMWIAAGGSSVTGTLGYVSAALELEAQIARGELPPPDVIYVALGSCGTVAGLLAGLQRECEIRAVRVVDRWVCGARPTRSLMRAVEEKLSALGVTPPGARARLHVEHDFFGGAYGRATPASDEAVAAALGASLRLEPTYTGKCMAALLADARAGRLDGKRVLFWHTYNGVDLAPLIAGGPGPTALPALLRKHFAQPAGHEAR